ncbi:hypothetical protein T459_29639 [Capsicum annuum]|uniref:Uncharacterized protein n=1 Tax=Capsicum annuum TaxID=4072 RepID=A0A2G2Y650_CAPAN|nr:hypothetical protein T459_29639 [Capsicum annuum]
MALRSRIDLITTDTLDWTCKVQIVDISRERKSPEKQILFQNRFLEDEQVRNSPKSYGRTIHTYWILDKETIVECINPTDEIEKPLPPSTKLNLTALANVAQMTPTPSTEIEKEQVLPLTIDQRNAKKVRPLTTNELRMEPTIVESGSSIAALELTLEPLTPAKKLRVLVFVFFGSGVGGLGVGIGGIGDGLSGIGCVDGGPSVATGERSVGRY